jgi:hypothetical protein
VGSDQDSVYKLLLGVEVGKEEHNLASSGGPVGGSMAATAEGLGI